MEQRDDKPHDVLAAEEFAMPTRDDRYPQDPTGIQGPHDVLAAEEFAMPTGGYSGSEGGFQPRSLVPPILLVTLVSLLVRRRRRRR